MYTHIFLCDAIVLIMCFLCTGPADMAQSTEMMSKTVKTSSSSTTGYHNTFTYSHNHNHRNWILKQLECLHEEFQIILCIYCIYRASSQRPVPTWSSRSLYRTVSRSLRGEISQVRITQIPRRKKYTCNYFLIFIGMCINTVCCIDRKTTERDLRCWFRRGRYVFTSV